MLVYHGDELAPIEYTDYDFQSDADLRKSTFGYVFTLRATVVSWRCVKHHVLLIQLWKLNMWQHQRQLKKQYGLGNSLWN